MKRPYGKREKGRRDAPLLGGVLILAVANLLVKVFGFLYKVPLNSILGDEMANVNAAYSVYTLLYMLSTAGIPVGVSVLVSEARAKGQAGTLLRILRSSLALLCTLGALGTAGMLFLAPVIAGANSGGDSYLCLVAIAPSLFFICISSVLRGYFQGFGRMTPTAISGILEAVGKMAIGLLLVRLALGLGGDSRLAAAFSVFGITVGIALGTLSLFLAYLRARRRGELWVPDTGEEAESTASVIRRLARIALPIAASSGVLSLASLVDSQMMRPLLADYYGSEVLAKAVFSDYSTGAVTLFNLPAVLIYPIASAIVPHITAARVRGDSAGAGRCIGSAFRIAALISLPSALGMSVLAHPILSVVFSGDPDMAANAGDLLSLLALSVFPLALLSVSNAVLQACGRQGSPILSMAIGTLVKVTSLFVLTPRLGAFAAPFGTLLFYLTALLVNFYFIFRYTSPRVDLVRLFLAPTAASVASSLAAALVFSWVAVPLGTSPALLFAIAAAVAVYALAILPLGGVEGDDLLLLPKGERILRFLVRHHLIKREEYEQNGTSGR